MRDDTPALATRGLVRRYGHTDAVAGLDLTVRRGRCYGFFGRNGAGKTTTIKCLLNLLTPTAGRVEVFGLDPARHEVAVKSRLSYVPDRVAFYPWMTAGETLAYCAAFRSRWNRALEASLLERFRLDSGTRTAHLSKGQRTQLALVAAIAAEPDLLVLDEPTSGLDPIVRREFIETVIGAYQDADPTGRTVFVSTHLIAEFEGLIDEFTVIEQGRAVLAMETDAARARFQKLHARLSSDDAAPTVPGVRLLRRRGRDIELFVEDDVARVVEALRPHGPEAIRTEALTLEEIVVATLRDEAAA